MGTVILGVVACAICLGIGFCMGRMYSRLDGLFILDSSDPETQRWILDVHIDPKTIQNKKDIRLKVCKKDEELV